MQIQPCMTSLVLYLEQHNHDGGQLVKVSSLQGNQASRASNVHPKGTASPSLLTSCSSSSLCVARQFADLGPAWPWNTLNEALLIHRSCPVRNTAGRPGCRAAPAIRLLLQCCDNSNHCTPLRRPHRGICN